MNISHNVKNYLFKGFLLSLSFLLVKTTVLVLNEYMVMNFVRYETFYILLLIGIFSYVFYLDLKLKVSYLVFLIMSMSMFQWLVMSLYAQYRGISVQKMMIVEWGYFNLLLMIGLSILMTAIQSINIKNLKMKYFSNFILSFLLGLSAMFFIINLGYIADEYYSLNKLYFGDVTFSWWLLILSFIQIVISWVIWIDSDSYVNEMEEKG